jgi:hypothetical protein
MLRQERELGQAAIHRFRWPDSTRMVVLGQGSANYNLAIRIWRSKNPAVKHFAISLRCRQYRIGETGGCAEGHTRFTPSRLLLKHTPAIRSGPTGVALPLGTAPESRKVFVRRGHCHSHRRHLEHVPFRRPDGCALRHQYRSGLAGQFQPRARGRRRLACATRSWRRSQL